MIERKTVFVLGAGASEPYGFPLGKKLRWLAYENLAEDNPKSQFFRARFEPGFVKNFRNDLIGCRLPSVDALLEHRPEYLEIGKAAIAQALLPFEENDLFDSKREQNDWLQYLRAKMDAPKGEFGKNKISFVTLNYDRSLEQYLFTSLRSSYNMSSNEAASQISQLRLIHLHGQLGFLPWQNHPEAIVPYGSSSESDVWHAADQIRVISEADSEKDTRLLEAQRLLSEAERVIFLGFGYHATNLTRLNVGTLKGKTYGSSTGFTRAEAGEIAEKFGIFVSLFTHWDALGYLRETGALVLDRVS